MSLFPRIAFGPVRVGPNRRGAELAPILNLLDDSLGEVEKATRQTLNHFKPAFDVKETQEGYTLEGELPGVDQKDINIEFTDEYTLTVRGRVERHSESGRPSQAAIEGEKKGKKPLKPTVEDEESANASESKEVSQSQPTQASEPAQPQDHYWISERSVGEFSRTFTFPARVNQDAVKASLKNGVLTIYVPKAPAPQTRRIAVE
ncbi:hypothetical protein A1O1_01179 [Capronia coronata CBS 617.96]|uniref:SHSP domain-containing protein n=1 Tax=Capronia coronata CBS 617.96 TaxID=1182541 RepID=W9YU67_9EURO|nr:uncharacterized protein A1O1_01179 [Capronia coronata CBS 617.96]EXJ96053.1 hypothetical protein A1O1_01179 [Capronia coronata CBS 617.96]